MLSGLGTAVFASVPAPTWRGRAAFALGFAIAVVTIHPGRLPDATWISGLVASVAIVQLLRPDRTALTLAGSGALAGVWSVLLQMQGLPMVAALTVAAALPAMSSLLAARRPKFAPPVLREEGLLVVFALSLAVAMFPTITAGWRSAIALNLAADRTANQIVPAWVLGLTGASGALGGLYSLWGRR